MKQCKDAGVKIGKGEIRFGSWVTAGTNEFWSWSHWGCVTPKRVQNLLDAITEDGEKNFDLLDGYEDMEDTDRSDHVNQKMRERRRCLQLNTA